jgi:predicted nucleotidyltransferase component of viral defense system
MIQEWLKEYDPKNGDQKVNALREIMQEIALAGLQRAGFFERAAFYGGTALRIFYGLDRFSEDLDFSLLAADENFKLDDFTKGIEEEFLSLGMKVKVNSKQKSKRSNIDSAFLKTDTLWEELTLEEIAPQEGFRSIPEIRIKIEVDRKPPLGFFTEEKLLLRPYSFYVKCFTLPDLFAGKIHAVIFRNWKTRVKGRDWYDLEWYIKNNVPLNLSHFLKRATDSGDWKEDKINEKQFGSLLQERISEVSFDRIKEDIVRFIPDDKKIEIWSPQYFRDLTSKLKFEKR